MAMTKGSALVVFSGGQDSTTCLGWALANYDKVQCITFDYGQRHVREIEAASEVLVHFARAYEREEIPWEIVEVPNILHSASPLTSANELETYASAEEMEKIIGDRVEKTFVPMRNTLFLTIAANRAVAAGIDTLVTGVCQEDNANYPDCRAVFIRALEDAFSESLGVEQGIRIETPLMHRSKADTVRLALDTPYTYAALAWSHTAYDGQFPPVGRDHASVLRAHGFEQAERPDPLVLRAHYLGLMDLPETPNYRDSASFIEAMKDHW